MRQNNFNVVSSLAEEIEILLLIGLHDMESGNKHRAPLGSIADFVPLKPISNPQTTLENITSI